MGFNWRKFLVSFTLVSQGNLMLRHLNMLRSIDFYSQDDIQLLQDEKLKALLLHAYTNVKYYGTLFDKYDIIQNNVVDLAAFKRLPLLNKDIILSQGTNLYSVDHQKRHSFKNSSGGSTGQPVVIMQDKSYLDVNLAGRFMYNEWGGKFIGEPEIKFWGSERDALEGKDNIKTRFKRWLFNTNLLNTYCMSDKDLFSYVTQWNQIKPTLVWAYTDSIYKFSQFLEKHQINLYKPTSIICTTSPLLPEMREYIEKIIGCPVLNQYGSREVGCVAAECLKREGLHVLPLHNIVEILDDDNQPVAPGVQGKVVITNLNNYSMPLLRYDIGDTAYFSDNKCSCGRQFPILGNITGRKFSHFKKRDGALVHSQFFVALMFYRSWVKAFRITQIDYDKIEIKVSHDQEIPRLDKQEITQKIVKLMGSSCTVDFVSVDEVAPTSSGKYFYTICNIGD